MHGLTGVAGVAGVAGVGVGVAGVPVGVVGVAGVLTGAGGAVLTVAGVAGAAGAGSLLAWELPEEPTDAEAPTRTAQPSAHMETSEIKDATRDISPWFSPPQAGVKPERYPRPATERVAQSHQENADSSEHAVQAGAMSFTHWTWQQGDHHQVMGHVRS